MNWENPRWNNMIETNYVPKSWLDTEKSSPQLRKSSSEIVSQQILKDLRSSKDINKIYELLADINSLNPPSRKVSFLQEYTKISSAHFSQAIELINGWNIELSPKDLAQMKTFMEKTTNPTDKRNITKFPIKLG